MIRTSCKISNCLFFLDKFQYLSIFVRIECEEISLVIYDHVLWRSAPILLSSIIQIIIESLPRFYTQNFQFSFLTTSSTFKSSEQFQTTVNFLPLSCTLNVDPSSFQFFFEFSIELKKKDSETGEIETARPFPIRKINEGEGLV